MSSEADELLGILGEDKRSGGVTSDAIVTASETRTATITPPIENDNLTKIVEAREQIALVKKNLSTIVDSIANNPSLITRASEAWGGWPTWQKVGTGIVLTVPALLVGVAASVGSLLLIGGATGVAYTTTGLILEDHHACNVNIKQRLKDGILSLADVLELTIVALDSIRLKLAEELAKFKEENSKLALEVSTLQDQIHTLSIQVGILIDVESFLRATKEQLHKEVQSLKSDTKEQRELLEKQRDKLAEVTREYQITQESLTERVKELRTVREQMATEIASTRKVSESLQKAVTTLSGVVIEDQKQRETFQAQLFKALKGEETCAIKVMERMSLTQGELETATSDLRFNNDYHRKLLEKQGSLLRELEALDLKSCVAVKDRISVLPHTMFTKPAASSAGIVVTESATASL
jgi:hypothetical protein